MFNDEETFHEVMHIANVLGCGSSIHSFMANLSDEQNVCTPCLHFSVSRSVSESIVFDVEALSAAPDAVCLIHELITISSWEQVLIGNCTLLRGFA